jgi:tyrosine-protein phosphatase 2/3
MQNMASFDYTDPRCLHGNASPELLSSHDEPVRCLLEDMREQRMSLCQSLRQYVFVHRLIVEGVLDIVDEARAVAQLDESPINYKRGPSPTELTMEDRQGAVRLTKRPSFNRRERNGTYSDAGSVATR